MTEKKNKQAETAATVALFATILIVSIALALLTDMHIVARGAIAIGGGIAMAATTFVLVGRRRS